MRLWDLATGRPRRVCDGGHTSGVWPLVFSPDGKTLASGGWTDVQDHPEAASVDAVDRMFYTEVLRRENFDVDSHEVRSHFDFARVRQGLLDVTGRLFDVEYVERATWRMDVVIILRTCRLLLTGT